MSVPPSKLLVGFIGFIISVCLYSGVGIAEQIVETESRVVLEVGTRGILPCRIQRKAHLVQWTWWTRELTSEHYLAYLDIYSTVRRRGGPGYKEGFFNITEDYSLIIKDVKVQDEGLYICEVSDFQTGKVFRNKTRVFVRGTGASAALEMGAGGILPCGVQRGAYEVKWKRQLSSDMSETELLLSFDQFFNVGERDGPGYKAGLFNITDDYSLVIKDVKVQDEGLYTCTLFDYKTGRVFRNSTRVFVQAFPEEPFPVIQECIGIDIYHGACTFTVHATSNLTCFVREYYPDIDLFFLHGSEKVTSTEVEEWHNADGTKNKEIIVQISGSDEPYQCVASGLPGIGGNRSVSVIVQARAQAHSQGPNAAVTAVPVIVGVCLSIAAIFIYHRRKRKGWWSRHGYISVALGNTSTHLKDLGGPISKLELWQLIKYAEENGDCEKLGKVVRRLLKNDTLTLQSNLGFYESLCTWKRETSSHSNQREILYSALNEVGMSDLIWKLLDVVIDSSREVSRAILGHILWEIKETSKIIELLRSLQLNHQSVAIAVEKGRREVVYRANRELVEWRKRGFHINPLVILSLKLDELECETNFFKIPSSEIEDIDECELRGRISKVICQHLTHLLKFYGDIHGEDQPYQIETLVQENHESLFNTIQMLQDWVKNEECNNHEIRNKLRKAAKSSLERDHTADKWPPDDELRVIASFLSPAPMEQLCSKLGVTRPPQEANKDEPFQALAEWRDNHASSKDLLEKHTELITALKEVGLEGLIPRAKGPLVYKAELVDLAFHLFTQDLLPFTEALGISESELVTYRPTFHPSHMTQGTIGLVCKLFEFRERSHLLKLLKKIPYPNVSASGMFALEISFGEVCAISVSPANIQTLKRMQESFTTSTSVPYGDDSTMANVEKNLISPGAKSTHGDATCDTSVRPQSQNKIVTETMNVLMSAIQVENHDQVSAECLAFLNRFKVWRERPRLSSFNFRLALHVASHLRCEDNYCQISDFLPSNLSHYYEGIIPFAFIHNILQTMDPKQREVLGNLIRDASFKTEAHNMKDFYHSPFKDQWFELTKEVIKYVNCWKNEWILEMILAKGEKGKKEEIAKKHKECNDKLVDNGFLDLAREIMISEQLSIDVSGFTSV